MGAFWGCVTEERYIGGGTLPGEEDPAEVTLTLSARVPGQTTPLTSTRAMDEIAENHIETLDVLVFEVNALNDEEYLYRVQAKNIQQGITPSEKSFEVTLTRQTGKQYRLVLLANASAVINALEPITAGIEKEQLLEQLIYQNSSEWNATGAVVGTFDPFPMWGESEITLLNDNMQISGLKFLRMVARVDVALTDTISNFTLKEVYLYNRQSSGHIVPSMADTTWTATGSLKVQRATVPAVSSTIQAPRQPHPAAGDTACIQEIYLMESRAGTSLSDATCIVVGGEYGTTGTTTYYRLDFLENDRATYKDILRNHLYRFTIMGVSGAGHTSPDEAFQAIPLNMEAEILEWDESEMPVVVFDGQYMLSVNQEAFTFSREVTTTADKHNLLLIYTDYDVAPNAGWKIEKIVDAANTDISSIWLNADSWSGLPNTKSTVHLLLQENTTGAERTGYIHITAGRLSYVVTVTQSEQSGFSLTLYEGTGSTGKEITELVFSGRASEISAQQFTLEWLPKTESPQINVRQTGNAPFAFGSGSDQLTDNTSIDASVYSNGSRTYTILPPAMTPAETDPALGGNPFLEKSSRIDFTINNGTSYLTKNIFLRQINYGISFNIADKYLMDGNEHSFTVKSNATWTATVTSNPGNVIRQLITTSGGNNITGQEVKFKIVDDLTNPSIFEAKAEITFISPRFDPVVVEINCASGKIVPKSNSYIVKPDDMDLLIPVDRANDHEAGAIGASDTFTAELVWTDNSNRIADNSNIKLVTAAGLGHNGHILVLPGSAEGNAVVAVRSNVDNEIKWSWHIWVTNYDPDASGSSITYNNGTITTVFMDRNLGATTNTVGSQTSMGLLYQWGRKDPFPGADGISSSTDLTVYNASGVTNVPASISTPVADTGTLTLTIANPTNYYVGSNNSDWYSSTANTRNDNLWNSISNTKTIYDPCPEGWRVPISGGANISPWYNPSAGNNSTPSLYGGTWHPGWNFVSSSYNLGYYPAAGYRNYANGTLRGVGSNGHYWSASPQQTWSYNFHFLSTTILPNGFNGYRGYGFSVRCVQE